MHYFGHLKCELVSQQEFLINSPFAAVTISCITSRVLPCWKTSRVTRPQLGREGVVKAKREAQAQTLNTLQTWQSDLNLSQSQWERKVRNRQARKREKWQWLREELEPVTWHAACHALTNWATESMGSMPPFTRTPALPHPQMKLSMIYQFAAKYACTVSQTTSRSDWMSQDSLFQELVQLEVVSKF